MFEATAGEKGEEEAAAASADTERPQKLSDCSKAFEQNCRKSVGVEPSHREKCGC